MDNLPSKLSNPQLNLEIDRSLMTKNYLEAVNNWSVCCQRSAALSRHLCESLRLVLDFTKVAKLKGDFRTGKRINMRKARLLCDVLR